LPRPDFRDVLGEVDPTLPVYRVRTMEEEIRSSPAANRFQMTPQALLGTIDLVPAAAVPGRASRGGGDRPSAVEDDWW
jgi:hypothetical protein